MSAEDDEATRVLAAADQVAGILARSGVESALIGAIALAVYRYPRSTEDVDLAIGTEPHRLAELARELERDGFTTEVSAPDDADPLGGVVRVHRPGAGRVEIVNFCNPPAGGFPALIRDALRESQPLMSGRELRVVTLPHLIVFKLYAGGLKSKTDVLELLSRNPELDVNALRDACRPFRLDRRLEAWLRELTQPEEA